MASWKAIAASAAIIVGVSAAAHADKAAGDACAGKLNPDGKAVYAAVVSAKPTTETLRSVVEREARGLVMGGKISRGPARENAAAAGECAQLGLQ